MGRLNLRQDGRINRIHGPHAAELERQRQLAGEDLKCAPHASLTTGAGTEQGGAADSDGLRA